MSNLMVLLISAYVYAHLIMAPVLLAYLLARPQRFSLKLLTGFHKLLVVLTVVVPVALVSVAVIPVSPDPEGIAAAASSSRPVQVLQNGIVAAESPGAGASSWELSDELQTVNDVAYFYGNVLAWLSVAGFLVFLARYARQLCYVRHLVRTSTRLDSRDGIEIVSSTQVDAPYSVGCVARRIFLPTWLEPSSRDIVILHEINHFRCGHHWWAMAEALLAHVFWFNPVSHLLRRRGGFYRELECDLATTREVDRFRYAHALIESAAHICARQGLMIGGHAWIEKNRLRARIDFILGQPRTARRLLTQLVLVIALAAAGAGFVVVGNVNDQFLQDEILETINREYADTASSQSLVNLDQVPDVFVQGLLLYYDRKFYSHDGVSLFTRSTLTQQLAKSFLQNREPTINRKIRELKVARVLEQNFSKEQILEMYLNRMFWGNRAWGLAAAAAIYYGKAYTELTRSESAMLIPFLDAPSAFNMLDDAQTASRRQQQLLARMNE